MKRITVIGYGFSGLSIALELLRLGWEVTVVDKAPVGNSTSAMAAGLLHLYTGKAAKRSPWGEEALFEAQKLLELAGNQSIMQRGILRIALDEALYYKRCQEHPDLEWWPQEKCSERIEGLIGPGMWIQEGLAINAANYVQGLWKRCEELGAKFERQELSQIDPAQKTVVCAGFESAKLLGLPIKPLKGQLLHLEPIETLPFALNGHGYLLQSPSSWIAGSTFERGVADRAIDEPFAKEQVLAKIRPFYPRIDEAKVRSVHAGVRGHLSDHLPLYKQLGPNRWALTALGSKGLLVSALLAKRLGSMIDAED